MIIFFMNLEAISRDFYFEINSKAKARLSKSDDKHTQVSSKKSSLKSVCRQVLRHVSFFGARLAV